MYQRILKKFKTVPAFNDICVVFVNVIKVTLMPVLQGRLWYQKRYKQNVMKVLRKAINQEKLHARIVI